MTDSPSRRRPHDLCQSGPQAATHRGERM